MKISVGLGCVLVGLLASACSAGRSDDAASGPEQDITRGGKVVTGAKAERIIASLDSFDAVDHAMGGRASVDISNLTCLAHSNVALDATDPSYRVSITECGGDVANRTPAHVDQTDAPQKAAVMFDSIGSIDDSFEDSAMGGHTFAEAKSVSCNGQNANASCTVTNLAGRAFTVSGDKALRITQAFGLVDAVDHAMGGRFGVDATDVKCERSSRAPLDDAEPGFDMPIYNCGANVAALQPPSISVTDGESHAADLMDAIAKAGIEPDAAMGGKLGLGASHLTCTKGPGVTTSCTLKP